MKNRHITMIALLLVVGLAFSRMNFRNPSKGDFEVNQPELIGIVVTDFNTKITMNPD